MLNFRGVGVFLDILTENSAKLDVSPSGLFQFDIGTAYEFHQNIPISLNVSLRVLIVFLCVLESV